MRPITKEEFNRQVTIRSWGKKVERRYCNPSDSNGRPVDYIANITWGIDMYCGGNTADEAKNNLFLFVNDANHEINL